MTTRKAKPKAKGDKKKGSKKCGKKTKAGKLCRWPVPCPNHDRAKTKRGANKKAQAAVRQEKMIQLRMQGKNVKEAALGAGFPKSVAEGKIYQIIDAPSYKQRVKQCMELASIQTDEIIGVTVSQLRMDIADLFPEDAFLQRAKALGISANVKRIKYRPIVAGYDKDGNVVMGMETDVECYSSQEAAKMLGKNFGLEQLPAPNQKAQRDLEAMLDRLMQQAEERGIPTTRERLREKLKKHPQFKILFDELKVTDTVS